MNYLQIILLTTAFSGTFAFSNVRYIRSSLSSKANVHITYMVNPDVTFSTLSTTSVVKEFEPQLSSETSTSIVLITILCIVATAYWWNVVIPDRRTALAVSKRQGQVKEYLDELRTAETDRERPIERWIFTDWLRQDRIEKSAALPFLKKVKWNSGDNPILVAFAGIMSLVLVTSVLERI